MNIISRREFMKGAGILGSVLILEGCGKKEESKEVTAAEDLMREHGVLRRALFVYSEAAARIRNAPLTVAPDALNRTAALFRSFGEDYHERKLEEAYIFPAVKKARGAGAEYIDVLIAQHQRGREITDYILTVSKGKISRNNAGQLSLLLDAFVRMYRPHTAREDTVVFPAWKKNLSAKEMDEMNEKFEDIEHKQFGKDGFENAVLEIGKIEKDLGLGDLSQFTPGPPQLP